MLIALTDRDRIVGAIKTLPPPHLLDTAADYGIPNRQATAALVRITKIQALAVAPAHRRRRLGTRLLDLATRLHQQTGARLIYGHILTGSTLAAFYTRNGFDVLPPRHGIALAPFTDTTLGIAPAHGEQLFATWTRSGD